MKNLILLTFIFTFSLQSCGQNTELGKDKLNLEKFNLKFDVAKFYANEIEKEQKYEEQKDLIIEKILEKEHTEKEIKKLDEKLSELNNFKWIKIDTIYNDPYNYDYYNRKNPIGIQYNMGSWRNSDNLGYYGKMHFAKIEMTKSFEGDFMALVALNESKGTNDFKQLLSYIEQKHGKAIVKEYDFFGSYFVYFWELKDHLLAISSKYDNKENTLKLDLEVSENNIKVDTTKHPTINTTLFILNNKYKNDSILRNFNSGDWLFFNQILDKK